MSLTTGYTDDVSPMPERHFAHSQSRMSWGAVLAGTAVAVAVSLLLGLLGVAIGASALPVTGEASVAAATRGAGIWMVINMLVSMGLGGYVAGRLAGTFSHLDSELHGLTVWALTALLSAVALASLVNAELSMVDRGVGLTTGAATAGPTASGGGVAGVAGLTDQLQQSLGTGSDPAHMTRDQITAEIRLLIGQRLANGALAPSERDRLIALVMQRDGLGRDEATLRAARMEQEAAAATIRTRSLEENAVETARNGARAVTAALLLGLAGSLLGAWFGTRHVRRIAVEVPVHHAARVSYETPVMGGAGWVAPTVFHLRGLSFPAGKAELLRQARAAGAEPDVAAALERVTDRRYLDLQDLMTELRVPVA
jgi:Protein of unknown function (DUF2795)